MRPSTDAYKKYMGYNGVPGQQRSSATVSTAPSGLWSAAGRSYFAFDDAFKELTGSSPVKSKTSDDKPVVSDTYARSAAYQAPASSAGSTPKLSTSAQAGAQFPSTAQNTSALPSAAAAVPPPGIKKTSGLWSASGRPGIAKQGASHGTGGGNADASAGTSKPAPPPTISNSAAGAAAAPGHVVHKSSDTVSSASRAAKSAQAVKASSGTAVETTKVSKPTSVASAPEQPRHWSVPVPGPAPPAWPPQQRSVAEAKKSGEGLQAATTSSALTVEGVAKRLLPFLGPGLAPLMLQVAPPPVLRDPAAGYYPQSLRRKLEAGSSAGGASGRTSPAMGVKISAPFDGKKGTVVSHHAEPMVDEFGREIDQMPLMATNASSRHHHHMNIDQSRDFDARKGIGGFVKVQDSVFVDALLQIPLRSIATPETLRILVARGTSAYEPLVAPAAPEPVQQQQMQMQEQVVLVRDAFGNFQYQTIHAPVPASDPAYHHHHQQQHGSARKPGSGRLQEPPGCPYSLLPHLPRPGFNDYFGHSNGNGSSKSQVNEGTGAVYGSSASSSSDAVASTTTLVIGSGRPGVAWPRSWAQYHATFACLLLEEARAALAGTAMEAARQRVRGAVASARQSTGADSGALGGADADRRGRDEHTTVECLLTASKPFGNKDKRNRWDKDMKDPGFNAAGSSKVNTEPRHVLLTLTSSVVPSSAPGQQSNGGLRALAPRDIVVIRPFDQVLEQCVDASTALPALPQLRDHGLPSALPMSSSPSSYYAQPQHQHSSSRPDVTPCFLGIVQDSARDMRDRNSHNNGNGNGASASSSVSSRPTDAVTIRIIMPSSAGYPVPEVGTPGAPSRWRLIQLGSMSTLLLQYNSVAAVAHTCFAGPVFAPSAASPTKLPPLGNSSDLLTAPPRPPAVPEQLYRALCKRYDPSQMRVIFTVACGGAYTIPIVKVNNDGQVTKAYASASSTSRMGATSDSCEVTTVIGPPGTGKTRTVLGMISALKAVLAHAAETAASEGGTQQQAAPRNVAKDAATGRHILKPTAVSHTALASSAATAAAAAASSSRPSSQPASKAPSRAASPAKEVDAAPAAVVDVGAAESSSAATSEQKPAGGVVIVLDDEDDDDDGDDANDGSAGAGAPALEPASGTDAIDARAPDSLMLASSDAVTADVDASVEDIINELSQKHADSVSGAAGVPVHGDAGEGKYKDVISIASDDDDAATVANAVDDDDDVVLVGSSQVARAASALVPAVADAAGAGTTIADGGGVDHLDGEGDDGDVSELDGGDAVDERPSKSVHVATSTVSGLMVKKLPTAIALSAAAVKSRVPAPATIANHDDDDDDDDAGTDDEDDTDDDDDDDGGGLFIADSASSVVAQKRKDKLDKEASDIAVAAGLVGKKRGRKGAAAGSSSKAPRLVTSSSAGSALTGLQTTRVVTTAAAKVPVGKPAASALSASAVATASSTPSAAVAPPRPPKHIRVLICAPSNAACDEICARLLDLPEEHSSGTHTRAGAAAGSSHHHQHNLHSGGLLDASGRPFIPTVVRAGVGGSSSTRPEVVSVALERHVQRRMAKLLLRLLPIAASAAPHPTRSAKIAATRTSAALRLTVVRKEIAQTEAMFRAAAGQAAAASGHGATSTLLAAAGVASSSSKPDAKAASTTAVPVLPKPVMDPGTASRLRHLRREERDLADVITALSSPAASLISPGVADALRIQAVCEVMDGADVICTTLAGCGQLPNAWSRAEAGWLQVLCDIPPGSTGRGDNDADIINSIPALKEAHDYPAAACALALRFDAIIVDEAGQAIEPEVLAPLRLAYMGHIGAVQASKGNIGPGSGGGALSTTSRHDGPSWCRRFVMVGDPLQLPATVMSRAASDAGLDVSLFERLSAAGIQPLLLRSQYRMHGAISAFASGHFYRGMVKDAAAIHARASSSSSASAEPLALLQHTSHVPVHVDTCLRPVLLIDVPFGHESQGGANTREGFGIASDPSYGNDAEAAVAVALAGHILKLIADAKAKAETAATAGNKGKGSGQRKQNAAGSNPQNSLPDGKTLVVTNKQTHVVGTGGNTIAAMAPATAAGASSSAFAVNVEAVADMMDISSNDDSDVDGNDGDAGSDMELEEEEEAVAAPVASSAPTSRLDRHASGAGAGLPQQRGGGPHRGLVGIISPYREQVKRIRAMLALHLDEAAMKQVVVSSVDSFQGQEMDHVIISCVRSAPTNAATSAASSSSAAGAGTPTTIGFLADKRRLNVAVTRARHTLAIVCNASHLSAHDRDWAALIQHARRHADLDALKAAAAAIGNQKAQTFGISVTLGQAIARPDRPVVSAALPAPAAKPAQLVPLAAVYSIPQHLPSPSSSSMHGKAKKHQHGPADCCSLLIAELQKVHKNQ